MLQVDPNKRITAQRLQSEYAFSEAWSDVRHGYATRKCSFSYPQAGYLFRLASFTDVYVFCVIRIDEWMPHPSMIVRSPAGRMLDFLTFRAHDDPVAAQRDREQVKNTAQFEYFTPEVFGFYD